MISLEALRQHLVKERENGAPTAILFAQVALFSTSLFLHKTNFTSKHDKQGTKTALFYQIVSLLLRYSNFLSRLKFLRQRRCGYKVNTIANLTCLVLAIILDNLYEKSLASLGVVLSIAVLVLVLLIIIRPRSDLGFLGFLIGVAGSIASNRYKLGYRTWIVGAICFVIFGFRCWLDQNWLQLEEDEMPPPLLPTTSSTSSSSIQGNETSEIIEALIVIGCYLYWDQYLLRTNCPNSVIFCIKKSVPSVVVLGLCSSLAIALRLRTMAKLRWHLNKKLEKVDDDDIIVINSEQHADAAPVLLATDTLKQRHKQGFLKVVMKLDVQKESKHKAMKIVSTLPGVDSIAMDMKDKKMTVIGDVDPVEVLQKLRKKWYTEILSIGPAKEPEMKEDLIPTITTSSNVDSVEEQKNTEDKEKVLTETPKEEE